MSFRDWQVGDRVVCAGDAPVGRAGAQYNYPKRGGVYTIREITLSAHGNVCLLLVEVVNSKQRFLEGFCEPSFTARYFRKVEPRKTSIAILERFLLNPNAPVREDA